MALTILLADDSMTAQNMGKKILTEAGYQVVAVSNGAAAVKKIAEHKPDVAVLDVYMPGYTGLEVCERVKSAHETTNMPVLLTVGKMEPFKAEEGTRVKADGVIIKPFEASDLLAAVQKLEEKLRPRVTVVSTPPLGDDVPEYERTVKIPAPVFDDQSYKDWRAQAEEHLDEVAPAAAQPNASVPAEMQSAPAFADELEAHAPAAAESAAPEASDAEDEKRKTGVKGLFSKAKGWFGGAAIDVPEGAAAESVEALETVAPMEASATETVPFTGEVADTVGHFERVQSFGASAAAETPMAMPTPPPLISSAQATVPIGSMHANEPAEFETSAAKVGEIEVRPDPALESFSGASREEFKPAEGFEPTSPQSEFRVAATGGQDPNLVTDVAQMSTEFPTRFGVANAEPVPVGIASDFPELYAGGAAAAAAPAPEILSAPAAPEWKAEETHIEEHEHEVLLHEEMQKHFSAAPEPEPVAAAPAEISTRVAAEPERVTQPLENAPDPQLAAAMAAAVSAEIAPAVAQAASQATGDETQRMDQNAALIADIVHRVTERMKGTLVAEISKELEELKKKS